MQSAYTVHVANEWSATCENAKVHAPLMRCRHWLWKFLVVHQQIPRHLWSEKLSQSMQIHVTVIGGSYFFSSSHSTRGSNIIYMYEAWTVCVMKFQLVQEVCTWLHHAWGQITFTMALFETCCSETDFENVSHTPITIQLSPNWICLMVHILYVVNVWGKVW